MMHVSHMSMDQGTGEMVKLTHCHSCGLPDEVYIGREDGELYELRPELQWPPEHSVLETRVSVGSSMLEV